MPGIKHLRDLHVGMPLDAVVIDWLNGFYSGITTVLDLLKEVGAEIPPSLRDLRKENDDAHKENMATRTKRTQQREMNTEQKKIES